ncbi:MAG TPA: NERD domain-containing protein [Coleofasciculaceae cyanobacterium]|jgi:hypothetical protein
MGIGLDNNVLLKGYEVSDPHKNIMKTIFFALVRAVAIGASALGVATTANWANHKSYWEGTISRVQTTDFNILFHTLPTKLSYTLIEGDIEELQQTLNSNYGLFGMVVTNCTSISFACPNQQVLYLTESKLSWSTQLKVEDLSNYSYDLLQDPPPLKARGSFENSRATTRNLTGETNSGQVIGRVYYIRGIAPNFWIDYLSWIGGLPKNLLSDHGAHKYYSLTTSLFFLSGITLWFFIEWILNGKRLQKRLAQQDKKRMLKELTAVRQQLHERLRQVSTLIEERESYANELSRDQQSKDKRIQELEKAIAQLDSQRSAPVQKASVTTDLAQSQKMLQKEIQQREQTIAKLQDQIAIQIATQAQSNSGNTKALESLQRQLKEITGQQSLGKQRLEQYERDLIRLRQEVAQQIWEKNEKSTLVDMLKKQLQDAQQQTLTAEERRAKLERSVIELNHKKEQDSEKLIALEEEIQKRGQLHEDPTMNKFEVLVLEHLANSLQAKGGEWRILSNFDVSLGVWTRQFADFLIIGQGIVFVVEAKYYLGAITAEGDAKTTKWHCRSRINAIPQAVKSASKRNPYEQVNAYCDSTMRKLPFRKTNGKVKVYGIVVFPNGADVSTISTQIKGYSRVTTLDHLIQMIQDIEANWNGSIGKSALSPQQIEDLLCGKLILRKAA